MNEDFIREIISQIDAQVRCFYLKLTIICSNSLLFQLIHVKGRDMFYKNGNCCSGPHVFERGSSVFTRRGLNKMEVSTWTANLLSLEGILPEE